MSKTSPTTSMRLRTRASRQPHPFIGKGTGTRAYDHLLKPDGIRKGIRIREITLAGYEVLVTQLADGLWSSDCSSR